VSNRRLFASVLVRGPDPGPCRCSDTSHQPFALWHNVNCLCTSPMLDSELQNLLGQQQQHPDLLTCGFPSAAPICLGVQQQACATAHEFMETGMNSYLWSSSQLCARRCLGSRCTAAATSTGCPRSGRRTLHRQLVWIGCRHIHNYQSEMKGLHNTTLQVIPSAELFGICQYHR
jgi:hypothetical protein